MGATCGFSFVSLSPLLPSLHTSCFWRTLGSSVSCLWGLSSLGGAWACPPCCGVHHDGTLAPALPTRTVGTVLLQEGFGGWWVGARGVAGLLGALRWSEVGAGHVSGLAGGGRTICGVVEGKSDTEGKETL